MKITIIGAGVSGLAVACLLAKDGHSVTIYEKNSKPGGKVDIFDKDGYHFDTGSHLLSMQWIFNDFFKVLNLDRNEYLEWIDVEPLNRFIWSDGTVFDFTSNAHEMFSSALGIRNNKNDLYELEKFLEYSKGLYEYAKENFLTADPFGKFDLSGIFSSIVFMKNRPWKSMGAVNRKMFAEKHLREVMNSFALLTGSNPNYISSLYNLIPYLQINQGLKYPKNGIYSLVLALEKIAKQFDVKINYNVEINDLSEVQNDIVISNADAITTYEKILKRKLNTKQDYSTSAFIVFLGLNKKFPLLSTHNTLMSARPAEEINDVFVKKIAPKNPSLTVDIQSAVDSALAPHNGEGLYVMVNVPANTTGFQWDRYKHEYADLVIQRLRQFKGLKNIESHIVMKEIFTPDDIARKYNQPFGSIYGFSSNGILGPLKKPQNKVNDRFYLVGGSTHPGGGVPLCILSALIVRNMIKDKFY